MDYINSTPAADGFRMPAEFERHQGCIMIWPERPGSWAYGAKAAKKAFAQIASVISESEQVYMIVSEGRKEEAAKMLPETVRLVVMDTDDAWARDTGPTFVVSGNVDRVWKSFSPEDQKLLLECAAETEKYGKALSRLGMDDGSALAYLKSINKLPETTDCYAVMEANGMTVSRLSNEQIAALAKATEGVRKDWTAKIGADLVKAAEEDMASVR